MEPQLAIRMSGCRLLLQGGLNVVSVFLPKGHVRPLLREAFPSTAGARSLTHCWSAFLLWHLIPSTNVMILQEDTHQI